MNPDHSKVVDHALNKITNGNKLWMYNFPTTDELNSSIYKPMVNNYINNYQSMSKISKREENKWFDYNIQRE